jgi:hypothetical protein
MHGVINFRRRTAQPILGRHDDSRGHGALLGFAITLLTFGGWFQHLYTCTNEGLWGFLITGGLLSPIGIIHGWSVWFSW